MKVTKIRVVMAFAAVYLIWGSTYLAIRWVIETMPPFLMAAVRFITAGIILLAIVCYKNPERPTWRHWRSASVIGGLLLLGGNGGVVWAEQFVPSGMAALLIASVPLWMVLLDWIWNKKKPPHSAVFIGIALGFLGVGFLVYPHSNGMSLNPKGAVIVLLAAISWSIGSIYSRRADLPRSTFLATAMEMICGGTLLLIAGFMNGEMSMLKINLFSARSVWALAYLAVFGSLIALTAYVWLLRVVPAANVATYAFVNPIVAVFLGWALAHEHLQGHTFIAAILIIGAVFLVTMYQKKEPLKH